MFVIGITVSCSKPGGKPDNSNNTGDSLTETDDGLYHANVPKVNYDGADFIIMCRSRDSSWNERAVFGEKDDATVLGATTWYRNEKVSDMLGITLKFEEINTTVTKGTFYNLVLENSRSQDYICDICVQGVYDAMNLITTGII